MKNFFKKLISKILELLKAIFSNKEDVTTPIEEVPKEEIPSEEVTENPDENEEIVELETSIPKEEVDSEVSNNTDNIELEVPNEEIPSDIVNPVPETPIETEPQPPITEEEPIIEYHPLIAQWIETDPHVKECLDNGSISTEEMIDLLTPAIEENDEITEEQMYKFFKDQGMTDAGAAGLMGNLYAESGLKSNNLQNSYSKSLGYSDEEYTNAVDNGSYTNFINDKAGYGYAQWTCWSRKQNLLEFAIETGKSIGNSRMQLEFLMKELTESYSYVLTILKCATDVKTASDTVLLKFEKPADQSDAVKDRRASYGQIYYDKYAK